MISSLKICMLVWIRYPGCNVLRGSRTYKMGSTDLSYNTRFHIINYKFFNNPLPLGQGRAALLKVEENPSRKKKCLSVNVLLRGLEVYLQLTVYLPECAGVYCR